MTSRQILLRLPTEDGSVGDWIAHEADQQGVTQQHVILQILSDHYEVDFVAPRRGARSAAERE